LCVCVVSEWRDIPSLRLLHLRYDLMPQAHVTLVATEIGLIPPTSVPVVVRELRGAEM
jgi:translation initiation factor eIF-2B subunit delta